MPSVDGGTMGTFPDGDGAAPDGQGDIARPPTGPVNAVCSTGGYLAVLGGDDDIAQPPSYGVEIDCIAKFGGDGAARHGQGGVTPISPVQRVDSAGATVGGDGGVRKRDRDVTRGARSNLPGDGFDGAGSFYGDVLGRNPGGLHQSDRQQEGQDRQERPWAGTATRAVIRMGGGD